MKDKKSNLLPISIIIAGLSAIYVMGSANNSSKIEDLTIDYSEKERIALTEPLMDVKYHALTSRFLNTDKFMRALKEYGELSLRKVSYSSCPDTSMAMYSKAKDMIMCLKQKRDTYDSQMHKGYVIGKRCPEMKVSYLNEGSFKITDIEAKISEKYPNDIKGCAYIMVNTVEFEKIDWKYDLNERANKVISWAHYKSEQQMKKN